jgi:hypothetical protein
MSLKNYEPKTRGTQKIRLDARENKKDPQFINFLFSKVKKIEVAIINFENIFKETTQMEVDNPFEYALYCSSDWDPMDLD